MVRSRTITMPLDYSKWDNIEISDDEDIEVHPNVDKRSFIESNREAIHQRRAERRNKIKLLQERVQLISKLIDKIKRFMDGMFRTDQSNIQNILNELEQCATEWQYNISLLGEEGSQSSKFIDRLLIHTFAIIQADIIKEKLEYSKENIFSKLQVELGKIEAESSTLTSDNICKPGFDKTIVTKATMPFSATPKKVLEKEKKIEILNPKTLTTTPVEAVDSKPSNHENSEDSEAGIDISDLALAFSKLKTFDESFEFITKYPYFVDKRYKHELLALAFECELRKDCAYAEQCILQASIITDCIRLGKLGVTLFFKGLRTEGLEIFKKEAKETYLLLKEKTKVIAANFSEDSGKKAIFQLRPASEDSKFVVNIPAEEDIERYKLFTFLPTALQEALKTAEIDHINRALADLNEQEAVQALRICDESEFLLFDVPSAAA